MESFKNNQKSAHVPAKCSKNGGVADPTAPVAVFDSGAGGISVLRAIHALLPREELYYFGDSANAPYGERAAEEVRALTLQHAARLLSRAKALVVACNTATALAITTLRRRYPGVPILGIEPALKPAVALAPGGRVLVLATPTTLREKKFATLAEKYGKNATVLPLPAPELVGFVERGDLCSNRLDAYLTGLLQPYLSSPLDAVVLGCTHFPFVKDAITRVLGNVPMIDGAEGTARQLHRRLAAANLLHPGTERGTVTLTTSAPGALSLYLKLLAAGE
jgi:glutamate racemase